MRVFSKSHFKNFDWVLLAIIIVLCIIGLVMVMNATSAAYTDVENSGIFSRMDWHTVGLQAIWMIVGFVVIFIIQMVDYTVLGDYVKWMYGFILALLLLLLFSEATRGTQGWFNLIGDRTIQPSELGKIVLILILSKMISKKLDTGGITRFRDIIDVMIVFAIPFGLIMAQPDWGTAFVYACIFFGILFAANVNWKIILSIIGTGIAAIPLLFFVVMSDWQRERLLNFFDATRATSDSGLNVYNSKIAIGSGGLFGKGLFSQDALSSLNYVPEKHTDFIFSASVEAIGFIGGMIIIALFLALILRVLYLATMADDKFGQFIIIGVVAMEFFHIFENIGMTMGVMPVTGIPLPFISYGGSAMLANMIALGLVLNVSTKRRTHAISI